MSHLIYLMLLVFVSAKFSEASTSLFDETASGISKECHAKVNASLELCKDEYIQKWLSNETVILDNAMRFTCCSVWEIYDCFERRIKEQCTHDDWKGAHKDLMGKVEVDGTCKADQYYSQLCWVTEKDLNPSLTDKEKEDLLSNQMKISDNCTNFINGKEEACLEKVLKENNINMDNDKNDTKLDCCFLVPQFKCREDFGKDDIACNRNDMVTYIYFNERGLTNMTNGKCENYKCNSSNVAHSFSFLTLLFLMLFAFLN